MNDKDKYRYDYEKRMQLGVILLLNVPSEMKFGIDMSEWTIGAKFMGIKLVPLGVHYISFALKDEDYQAKQGVFISLTKKEKYIVRAWNEDYQTFVALKEEEEKNFKIGIENLDFDKNLGDYPNEQVETWKDLSKFITEEVIGRIQEEHRKYITPKKEYDSDKNNFIVGDLNYTNVNIKRIDMKAKTREEITKMNIDKSEILKNLIEKEYNNNENMLLGEFQFSFLHFLIGENYDSLLQWKNIIALLTSCESAINHREKFFCNFVECLYHQLRNFPKDLFYDQIIGNNFLKRYFDSFLDFSSNQNFNKNFTKRAKLFVSFLKDYFSYEIETEEKRIIDNYLNKNSSYLANDIDDDLPVIVDESEISAFTERINKLNIYIHFVKIGRASCRERV